MSSSSGTPSTSRRRAAVLTVLVVGGLVAANLAGRFGPRPLGEWAIPVAALGLCGLARQQGLSAAAMGLARSSLRLGLRFAWVVALVVAMGVTLTAALPLTRSIFLDERYRNGPLAAVFLAFVVIPFFTVLPEELIFRGVLLGALSQRFPTKIAVTLSSLLFGLWHVTSASAVANRTGGSVVGILVVVIATTFAGAVLCWLRLRSRSLLAPIGLHWALNGFASLAAAVVWSFS